MKGRADRIGDANESAPEHWVGRMGSKDVHAMLLLTADEPADLKEAISRHMALLRAGGILLLYGSYQVR